MMNLTMSVWSYFCTQDKICQTSFVLNSICRGMGLSRVYTETCTAHNSIHILCVML